MRPVEPANHVKNQAPLAHLEAGQYKNSLVSNGLVKRLLPTTKKNRPKKEKKWIFCTPGLSTRPGLLAIPMRANKLAISTLILILSIGMAAREPAVVDLTEENPSQPPASQQHQDWTENGAVTPPAPIRCPICLLDILPDAGHQNTPYQWPSCQHPIHLGCLLHLMTRRSCPTCPTCRAPWSPDTSPQLEQTRRAANVEWPVPEIPDDEDSPRDRPPNPPPDIIPLCCPRLVLIDPTQPELDSSWRELPSRHMDWAPNMDQTTREWQAEWVCLRCNNHITGTHPSIQYEGTRPNCSIHGPTQLAIDYRSQERGWICSTGYPPSSSGISGTGHSTLAARRVCSS